MNLKNLICEKHLSNSHITVRTHKLLVFLTYAFSFLVSFWILSLPESNINIVTLISSAAIIATFGSAICSLSAVWQTDLLERVRLNIDIFYKDIYKQDNPWRRWPFLRRSKTSKLLDGNLISEALKNPKIPLNVGSHHLNIDLPTVQEDFFDLSLIKNYVPLRKYREAAQTVYGNHKEQTSDKKSKLSPINEYMAYECVYDIWKTILKFRIMRYFLHFGSGLTIFSALLAIFHIY